jgi:hypothetical protein
VTDCDRESGFLQVITNSSRKWLKKNVNTPINSWNIRINVVAQSFSWTSKYVSIIQQLCQYISHCQQPTQQSWGSAVEAHETALQLEKDIYKALLELHGSANQHK